MRHAINSFIGYEAKVFEKINELAESDKQVEVAKQQNKPKHIITSLEIELMILYFELEDLGITTQDRWDASPKYWKNKVIEAKKRIESIDVKSVSEGFDKNSNIHFVHQTDLALKRKSLMTVPIWSVYGVTVPFPVVTWGGGWNQGSNTSEWNAIFTDGDVTFENQVCLDSGTYTQGHQIASFFR